MWWIDSTVEASQDVLCEPQLMTFTFAGVMADSGGELKVRVRVSLRKVKSAKSGRGGVEKRKERKKGSRLPNLISFVTSTSFLNTHLHTFP